MAAGEQKRVDDRLLAMFRRRSVVGMDRPAAAGALHLQRHGASRKFPLDIFQKALFIRRHKYPVVGQINGQLSESLCHLFIGNAWGFATLVRSFGNASR